VAAGPADGLAAPAQVASNYPAQGTTIAADMSTYLAGKPDGYYWVYLIGYTPVDRNDLSSIVDDRLVVSFNGTAASHNGGDAFNVPSIGSYPFGWVKLAAFRFYYSGTVDIHAAIITDK
jgi:hypothetical protein